MEQEAHSTTASDVLRLRPQVDLATGAVCALVDEAAPMPLDAQRGTVVAVGDRFARLLRLRHELRALGFAGELVLDVPLACLAQPALPRMLQELLAAYDGDGSGMRLEVTDTAAAIDVAPARAGILALRDCGVGLTLDNIGSARANLDRSALDIFDCLKIDRLLIDEMVASRVAIAGLAAILVFARGLGWRVVAEGVDALGMAERLALLGVAAAQGAAWAQPLEEAEVVDWWRQQREAPPFPVAQQLGGTQPPLIDETDRQRMAALTFPVWLFDADGLRLLESNTAGLRFWGVASNAELAALDLQEVGPAAMNRVRSYRNRTRSHARIAEAWVFYPGGRRHEVFCIIEPRRSAEGHLLLLVEMHEGLSRVAGDDIGGEFVRDTSAAALRLADDGRILWRNPAAEVGFGATARRLQQLAVAPEAVEALLETALAAFDDTEVLRLKTLTGERDFLCAARAVPVSGRGDYELLLSILPMPQR